jgi:hypothetical protein
MIYNKAVQDFPQMLLPGVCMATGIVEIRVCSTDWNESSCHGSVVCMLGKRGEKKKSNVL